MYAEKRTILVVEDNPDDEAMTLRALRLNNIENEITVVRDGAAAVEFLLGADGASPMTALPQVVLLDLKLPKMDGLQVLERIRGNPATKGLPVVILTSSDEEQDIARSYDLGVNSYVRKPVEFKDFTDAIRQLGMYWLLINKAPPRKVV